MSALLPLRQYERTDDGDQNQERSQFERVDEGGKEKGRDLSGGRETAGRIRIANRGTVPGHGGREQPGEGKSKRQAAELGQLREVGALFLAGVQEHDDENEQHHDRAAVNDDLNSRHEFGAHEQVQAGQSDHHHDQGQRTVDRMPLQDQADGADDRECGEDEENDERRAHALYLSNTTAAVMMTLTMETGSSSFQPMFMSWSSRKRGSVPRA